MVGGSGEISPLPPTIFVMITNQKWQLYRLCMTAPVGHAEPSKAVRASPRLHCIPSLQRYALGRIALCARIPVDYLCKLDAQKMSLSFLCSLILARRQQVSLVLD